MHRGAWRAIVCEVIRVGHELVTKPEPPLPTYSNFNHLSFLSRLNATFLWNHPKARMKHLHPLGLLLSLVCLSLFIYGNCDFPFLDFFFAARHKELCFDTSA